MEKARLVCLLGTALDKELEEDDIFIIEDDHEEPVSKISPAEFHDRLRFPLFEVLKYPYLLCYRDLCKSHSHIQHHSMWCSGWLKI